MVTLNPDACKVWHHPTTNTHPPVTSGYVYGQATLHTDPLGDLKTVQTLCLLPNDTMKCFLRWRKAFVVPHMWSVFMKLCGHLAARHWCYFKTFEELEPYLRKWSIEGSSCVCPQVLSSLPASYLPYEYRLSHASAAVMSFPVTWTEATDLRTMDWGFWNHETH